MNFLHYLSFLTSFIRLLCTWCPSWFQHYIYGTTSKSFENIRKKMLDMNIHYELFRMDESVNGALKRFLERRLKLI